MILGVGWLKIMENLNLSIVVGDLKNP